MKKRIWLAAFGVCMLLASLSPLASAAPDGLEKVAEDQGFSVAASASPLIVVADYLFPGVTDKALATILAAWLGTVIVFIAAYGAACLITRYRRAAS